MQTQNISRETKRSTRSAFKLCWPHVGVSDNCPAKAVSILEACCSDYIKGVGHGGRHPLRARGRLGRVEYDVHLGKNRVLADQI